MNVRKTDEFTKPFVPGLINQSSLLSMNEPRYNQAFPNSISSFDFTNSTTEGLRPITGGNRRPLVKSNTTAGIDKFNQPLNNQQTFQNPQIPIDQHIQHLSNSQSSSLLIPANSELNRQNQMAQLLKYKQQQMAPQFTKPEPIRPSSSVWNLPSTSNDQASPKISQSQSFMGEIGFARYSYFGTRFPFEDDHSDLVKSSTISSFAPFN